MKTTREKCKEVLEKEKKKKTLGDVITEKIVQYQMLYDSFEKSYNEEKSRPKYLKDHKAIGKLTLVDLYNNKFVAEQVLERMKLYIEKKEIEFGNVNDMSEIIK